MTITVERSRVNKEIAEWAETWIRSVMSRVSKLKLSLWPGSSFNYSLIIQLNNKKNCYVNARTVFYISELTIQ